MPNILRTIIIHLNKPNLRENKSTPSHIIIEGWRKQIVGEGRGGALNYPNTKKFESGLKNVACPVNQDRTSDRLM